MDTGTQGKESVSAEARLHEHGLELPSPGRSRPDFRTPFTRLRVHRNRIYISGQGARDSDGGYAGAFGSVPSEVSLEEAQECARKCALAIVGDLRRELGNLDRITAWLTVSGFVNADPGYGKTTLVMNGFSDLILELFGDEVGGHARSSIGVAALPNNTPAIVAAEIEFE
jgi:enamine deaminase RidA (YjgF/YER057c/UK114 family)